MLRRIWLLSDDVATRDNWLGQLIPTYKAYIHPFFISHLIEPIFKLFRRGHAAQFR